MTRLGIKLHLISKETAESALNVDDNPFHELEIEEDVVESLKDDLALNQEKSGVNIVISVEKFIDIDMEVSTSEKLTDVLAEAAGIQNGFSDDEAGVVDYFEEEVVKKPSFVEDSIALLENYSIFSNFGDDLLSVLEKISGIVEKDEINHKKQTKITDFSHFNSQLEKKVKFP